MQVRTSGGWGNWTPAYQFTLTPMPPSAPSLTLPGSGSILTDDTPTLSWYAVVGGIMYEIQISKNSYFSNPIQDNTLTSGELSYTSSALLVGKYYWRVRAFNSLDVPGKWSSYRTFNIIP
jgi:hypothetical protein